ncbi:MAG TPA: outer membrane beta-barrel protein [Steroidobacter sp.]|uniref:porin family protein n=1 Tax=Steroidobacter sp. TaxID=1978227 RepID=UPI002ED95037
MHKRMALNGLALLGLLASTTVLAEVQPGFYVGAGVGTAKVEQDTITDEDLGDFTFDSDDTAFKVFGGYNFNQYFAVEAAYFDGGAPEETIVAVPGARATLEIGLSGLIVSALGRLPLNDAFSLYGKLGLASYDVDFKGRVNGDTFATDSLSEDDVSYAVGASINVGASFELRAEYEAISIEDGDFNMITANGVFRF